MLTILSQRCIKAIIFHLTLVAWLTGVVSSHLWTEIPSLMRSVMNGSILMGYLIVIVVITCARHHLIFIDDAVKSHNIGVMKLCHECCLLQTPDLAPASRIIMQGLDSHLSTAIASHPPCFIHICKLPRANVSNCSTREQNNSLSTCLYKWLYNCFTQFGQMECGVDCVVIVVHRSSLLQMVVHSME